MNLYLAEGPRQPQHHNTVNKDKEQRVLVSRHGFGFYVPAFLRRRGTWLCLSALVSHSSLPFDGISHYQFLYISRQAMLLQAPHALLAFVCPRYFVRAIIGSSCSLGRHLSKTLCESKMWLLRRLRDQVHHIERLYIVCQSHPVGSW